MSHRVGRAGHLQDTNGFIKCHFYTALCLSLICHWFGHCQVKLWMGKQSCLSCKTDKGKLNKNEEVSIVSKELSVFSCFDSKTWCPAKGTGHPPRTSLMDLRAHSKGTVFIRATTRRQPKWATSFCVRSPFSESYHFWPPAPSHKS